MKTKAASRLIAEAVIIVVQLARRTAAAVTLSYFAVSMTSKS